MDTHTFTNLGKRGRSSRNIRRTTNTITKKMIRKKGGGILPNQTIYFKKVDSSEIITPHSYNHINQLTLSILDALIQAI